MDAKAALIAAARKRGAVAAGVSAATVDDTTLRRMRAAIARGDLATWRYDDAYAETICNPRTILAGAQSVFCIALPYAHVAPALPRGSGRISNYVWNADYHVRMREILGELLGELERCIPGVNAVAVCDTKPLAERAFAARAGLGWVGKHTNLIIPGSGSFVFLGEIVTDAVMEPDMPLKTHCGSCRLCIGQCPTGALRADYSMDATRCISDLTQRRDAIPREMRPLMGEWIWGCDICQEACPPVYRAPRQGIAEFAPSTAPFPNLIELLLMPPAEWKKRYAQSAMGWRGATVLRRNAAIALGNGGDRASVSALLSSLQHDRSALVRGHVAWALGRIASPKAHIGLHDALISEGDRFVREEISCAIDDICGRLLVLSSMEDSSCA